MVLSGSVRAATGEIGVLGRSRRCRISSSSGSEIHIRAAGLTKRFRVAERRPGTLGALAGVVRRRYRVVRAVEDVSFTVRRGELVGYIGPNGAGKSTTVKLLSGILVPDAGTCEVDGMTPWVHRRRYVASVGAVFGQRTQLLWDLPIIAELYRRHS